MENFQQAQSYQKTYLRDYGFEAEMVSARQRLILELLHKINPKQVLEIGSGPVLLYTCACRENIPVKKWVIVEPCRAFTQKTRERRIPLVVLEGFFEEKIGEIRREIPNGADMVICSGMLNEVRRPMVLLRAIKKVLARKGFLHINVPNAHSLHRQLGVAMGLIPQPAHPSVRNKQFLQYHVFDMLGLQKLVRQSGYTVKETGGYFLKPFAHKQMEAIRKVLTKEVLAGLWLLGRSCPEMATEIFVNVQQKNRAR